MIEHGAVKRDAVKIMWNPKAISLVLLKQAPCCGPICRSSKPIRHFFTTESSCLGKPNLLLKTKSISFQLSCMGTDQVPEDGICGLLLAVSELLFLAIDACCCGGKTNEQSEDWVANLGYQVYRGRHRGSSLGRQSELSSWLVGLI